jgi:hypothetical protein
MVSSETTLTDEQVPFDDQPLVDEGGMQPGSRRAVRGPLQEPAHEEGANTGQRIGRRQRQSPGATVTMSARRRLSGTGVRPR